MPQAIALEFARESGNLAANGSDVVMYLDGRWNNASKVNAIWRKIEELRSIRGSSFVNQHFVGYSRLGSGFSFSATAPQVRMSDPNPPAWVPSVPGRNPALWR